MIQPVIAFSRSTSADAAATEPMPSVPLTHSTMASRSPRRSGRR